MAAIDEQAEEGPRPLARNGWAETYARLESADREKALAPEDRERLATAAFMLGRDEDSSAAWTRAHQDYLGRGDLRRAIRCAFWLAFGLLGRGEHARGGGWAARARRLLDEGHDDCVEQGYLLLPMALRCIDEGDAAGAAAAFGQAVHIGDRFGERDLVALGQQFQGRSLIRLGRIGEGVSLLDEAMVAVEAGELSPIVVGNVYCSVISGCLEVFDLRRASEWTAQMNRWCESQADLVAYSGQCLVRRAEILQFHGAWAEADEALRQVCARQGPDLPALAAAWCQRGDLHRLRGEAAQAEEAYREASRYGRTPQPGLALLRLAQGQSEAAATAIRGALDERRERHVRARTLPAYVEIMVAVNDLPAAHAAAEELAQLAAGLDAPTLRAAAAQARGAVLLAEGDAQAALPALRNAWVAWQEVEALYHAAGVRLTLSAAYSRLGDRDAADMELDAAHQAFQRLGAAPDVARVAALSGTPPPAGAGGLSPREVQVLRLVATGRTNRAIAAELSISERTVERHVSNIFVKLAVSSRAAATAYAHRHQIV
jgi:DNA-binding CsgD family transcriptional regulator